MKKVLLYYPIPKAHETRSPPLPLLAISGLLLEKGYEVKIFDAFTDKHINVLDALDDSVICVGFSVMTSSSITDCLELTEKIKKKKPNTPVVWGGWHPSILPIQTIKHPHIDIVVKGQGEITFLELVQHLEKGSSLKKVLGITYKHKGKIFTNPDRPRVPLDDIPSLPYHLVNVEKYINSNIGKRTLAYVSSQGCPYNCAFCADALVYKRIRMELSAERVIKDLKYLIETYNLNGVMFEDTHFFINKEKVKKICKAIIKNKWNIKWGTSERIDNFLLLDEETLELVRDSGCAFLIVGAESGSQKVLDFLNKGIKVEDTLKFSKLCKKYGIRVVYDLIAGVPNETLEDFQKTKELIRKIYKIEKNSKLNVFFYTPYPGTPLYEKVVKEYEFKSPQTLTGWSKYSLSDSNTLWVGKEYKKMIRTFLFYLQFAFLHEDLKKRSVWFKTLAWSLHWTSWLRIKFDFFRFPIEKIVYDTIKRKIFHISLREGYL